MPDQVSHLDRHLEEKLELITVAPARELKVSRVTCKIGGSRLVSSSPSPILHPFHPHSTHLTPPVHENWPFEILNLYSLHDLSVEGLLESSGDPHAVLDPLPALMMMNGVEPKHRLLLITGCKAVQVLLPSAEGIPACLSFVGSDLLPTLITPEGVGDRLLPTIASLLSSTWKTSWSPTLLTSPRI